MPVLSLQPWSQFSSADPAKPTKRGAAGQYLFNGGAPQPLLLRASAGAEKVDLEQAVTVDGQAHACGAVLEISAELAAPDGKRGHVVMLDGVPTGVTMNGPSRLRPGDMVTVDVVSPRTPAEPEAFTGILCFAAGTQIETPDGNRRVETLRPGEVVTTADKGEMRVVWTGRREALFVRGDNRYRPVLFHAGSLGAGTPASDLALSPEHHVVLRGHDVAELTGNTAALVPAGALVELRGVRQMLGKRRITYIQIMLESHAILRAEGAEAESFYPTPEALATLNDDQRSSVFGHVPALRVSPQTAYGPTALPIIDWEDAANLAAARKEDRDSSQKLAAQ